MAYAERVGPGGQQTFSFVNEYTYILNNGKYALP